MKARSRRNLAVSLVVALSVVVGAAADGPKALESTPQVRAYRALLGAMKAGDYAAYKNWMVKEAGPRMDEQTRRAGQSPRDVLELMTKMTPPEVVVTSLATRGTKATLQAAGRIDGEMNYAVVELTEQEGRWRIERQSWSTLPAGPSAIA